MLANHDELNATMKQVVTSRKIITTNIPEN